MISRSVIARAAVYRQAFQSAQPFRHLCIDRFFTLEAAAASLRDFPPFDREFARNEFGEYGGKAVINDIKQISPFYRELYQYLMSAPFLDAMSALTGIADLRGDPALYGGGTHENINGQDLDIHVDFNFQIEGGLHRRANLLLYLNEEWDPAWGGAIELHSNPRRPDRDEFKQFNVIFNRAVIFETNEYSWHGFRKIDLPPDRLHLSRKCLSIYLYTKDRPAEEIAGPHSTFYVQWPLPKKFAPGHVLSESDVTELRTGYARRARQLDFYEKMAERLRREAQAARGARAGDVSDTALVTGELTIDFGGDAASPYRREGWADPEEHHTWATGSFSSLELPRPRTPGTYVMALEISAFCWPGSAGQRLTVLVNGSEVGNFLMRDGGALECVVPWSVLRGRKSASIGFRHPDAAKPCDVSDSSDIRELAFAFRRLDLFRLLQPAENSRHGFRKLAFPQSRPRAASIYLYNAEPNNPQSAARQDANPQGRYFVAWPFPDKFTPGRVLSDADVDELHQGYFRRDRQIELYQRLEERLGREIEESRLK